VLNKDPKDGSMTPADRDKIRYQYDEHYFLTDPDEFIQEFYACDPEWQLLERPLSREEFEALPFVRSVFFHHGLEFTEPTKAVLHADSKGGAEVKINVPDYLGDDIMFHYQVSLYRRSVLVFDLYSEDPRYSDNAMVRITVRVLHRTAQSSE